MHIYLWQKTSSQFDKAVGQEYTGEKESVRGMW